MELANSVCLEPRDLVPEIAIKHGESLLGQCPCVADVYLVVGGGEKWGDEKCGERWNKQSALCFGGLFLSVLGAFVFIGFYWAEFLGKQSSYAMMMGLGIVQVRRAGF